MMKRVLDAQQPLRGASVGEIVGSVRACQCAATLPSPHATCDLLSSSSYTLLNDYHQNLRCFVYLRVPPEMPELKPLNVVEASASMACPSLLRLKMSKRKQPESHLIFGKIR
jgi:hypothetical protein